MNKRFFSKTKLALLIILGLLATLAIYSKKIITSFLGFKKVSQPAINQLKTQEFVKPVETNESAVVSKKEKSAQVVSVIQNQDIAKAVRQAVADIGGIKLPKPKSIVLIKPNVNSNGQYPATTNPLVVETLIKLAYRAGAKKVIVADSSGVGWPDTLKNMARTGLRLTAEKAGAEVVDLEDKEWVRVRPAKSQFWPEGFLISNIINEVDYIISVPVIKTHATTGITLGLKNSVGLLHRDDRLKMHAAENISEMIAEINLVYQPDLIVFDGSKSFITRGPAVGKEVRGNYIVAGKEVLTTDVKAYEILRELGAALDANPLSHPMLNYALELGLPYQEI